MSHADVRVNLGSGPYAQPGWHNLDYSWSLLLSRAPLLRTVLHRLGVLGEQHLVHWSPLVTRVDLRKRLPYRDGEVHAIYSSHALEHLYLADAQRLLGECCRVLGRGEVIRLALPDFGQIVLEFSKNPGMSGMDVQKRINSHPRNRPTGKARIREALSGSYHRWQPTRDLVESMLSTAGFEQIEFCPFRQGELPDVQTIETREASFFVEAKKGERAPA